MPWGSLKKYITCEERKREGDGRQKGTRVTHRVKDMQSKKWCNSIEIFFFHFFWNSIFSPLISWSFDNITGSYNKNTSKRLPLCLWQLYYQIQTLIISYFCPYGLLIHVHAILWVMYFLNEPLKNILGKVLFYQNCL